MIHIFFGSSIRYNCAKFHHCKICVTDFIEGDLFDPLPNCEQLLTGPSRSLLNYINYYPIKIIKVPGTTFQSS